MALRGDLVGEAYVRITTDTSAMREAVKRDGLKSGKEYANAFSNEVDKIADDRVRDLHRRLAAGLSDTKDLDRLAKEYESVSVAADKWRIILKQLSKEHKIAGGELAKYRLTIDRWEESANNAQLAAQELAEANERSAEAARKLRNTTKEASVEVERHSSRIVQASRTTRIALDRATEGADRFGVGIGRVFGKGSRNNFLNWTGSMVGGLVRAGTALLTFPVRAIAHIGDTFGTAFSAARLANLGKMASAGRGLAAVFGGPQGVVAALGGVVAGAFILGKVLPAVVSLMTSLAGVVSALVGSIGIGLVGALLALGPASVGAVAGLGGVFGVITKFVNDDANKDFVKTLFTTPFDNFAKKFTPQVRTFLTTMSTGFKRLLVEIGPSTDRFFDSFGKRFRDPQTQASLDKWATSLGKIATSVNNAVVAFGAGFVDFFAPVLPYAEKLANYVEDIANRFSAWAQSAKGQNAVADFMKGAWENAKDVYDILLTIGSIFGTVFSSGDKTGKSFLDGILTKLQEIDTFLKTPAGRAKLDAWFEGVKGIGEDLGTIAVNIGKVIKYLNSPEGQKNAENIMNALVGISQLGVKLASVADEVGRIVGFLTNPALTLALSVFNSVKNGGVTSTPTAPPPDASGGIVNGPTIDFHKSLDGTPFNRNFLAVARSHMGLTSAQEVELGRYKVPVNLDTTVYNQTKAIVEAYKFTDKKVPVKGNEAAWNATKGTVAGYAFKPKVVKIVPNGKEVYDWVAQWNRLAIKNKTARINVSVSKGGGRDLTGGLVTATGGVFNGAQNRIIAEAGPEAVVPLNRPLSMVDPAVRDLSAYAQGKTTGGASKVINIHEGAFVIQTAAQSPLSIAAMVNDGLAAMLSSARV